MQLVAVAYLLISGPVIAQSTLLAIVQISGLILGGWAALSIKPRHWRAMSEPAEEAPLVVSGPYRFIRHPMYSSLLLLTLPMTLAPFNPARFCMWMLLVVVLIAKLRHEERILVRHFPEYERYARRTSHLVPFVY